MTGRRAGDVRKEKGGLAGELGAVDDAGKTGVYMTSRTHPLLPFRPHRKGGPGHTHEKRGCVKSEIFGTLFFLYATFFIILEPFARVA